LGPDASASIADSLIERRLDCGAAAFTLLVRSRSVGALATGATKS